MISDPWLSGPFKRAPTLASCSASGCWRWCTAMAMTFCSRRTFRGGKTRAASSSGCQLTLTEKDEVGLSCPHVIPGKASLSRLPKPRLAPLSYDAWLQEHWLIKMGQKSALFTFLIHLPHLHTRQLFHYTIHTYKMYKLRNNTIKQVYFNRDFWDKILCQPWDLNLWPSELSLLAQPMENFASIGSQYSLSGLA